MIFTDLSCVNKDRPNLPSPFMEFPRFSIFQIMLPHHLQTAIRNLRRYKAATLANLLGLTIGFTASFLLFLYIRFEYSYDSFHLKADRIYRLACDIKTPSGAIPGYLSSTAIAPDAPMNISR